MLQKVRKKLGLKDTGISSRGKVEYFRQSKKDKKDLGNCEMVRTLTGNVVGVGWGGRWKKIS